MTSEERTIAVLVRKNWQVNKIVSAAKEKGIDVEVQSGGDLFQRDSTMDLYRLVLALNNCRNSVCLVNLLESHFSDMQLDYQNLRGLQDDQRADALQAALNHLFSERMGKTWESVVNEIHARPVLYVLKKIYDAFQPWKTYQDQDEQRAYVANYEYLMELLVRNFRVDTLTLNQIAEYLRVNIVTRQERLAREDSIENAGVRILCTTVHKSKGLEYGTVILPYTGEEIGDIRMIKLDASYAANIFERAVQKNPSSPMSGMSEQIYAADSSVNNILKVYFPEQFGERKFLDYPLGHFFLAIANMWDAKKDEMVVANLDDMKECLNAGILEEEYTGQLYSIFKRAEPAFDGCRSVEELLKRLDRIERNIKRSYQPETQEILSHVSYYALSNKERTILRNALKELEELASYFYEDFENKPHNFKDFYKRLKRYLQEEIVDAKQLNDDFLDIVHRVLERLNEVEDIDASASFECLKSTMSVYLTQEARPEKSAHWIVRNFEQIDGDILRSKLDAAGEKCYHFACLSDADLNTVKVPEFPWPLDEAFFEVAQNPVDWKYQVYVNARREQKNFRRYALLYGLEFNRCNFKLSYVRQDREKDQELYYVLKILGAHIVPYREMRIGEQLAPVSHFTLQGAVGGNYNEFDYSRYKICKYRFLLETIIEGDTIYKDPFLLTKYLEVLLENNVRERCAGYPASETLLQEAIDESYAELKKYFPFVLTANQIDVVWNIRRRLLGIKTKSFPQLTSADRREMMLRELFIFKQLKNQQLDRGNVLQGKFDMPSIDHMKQTLSVEALRQVKFEKSPDVWCQYCSNRDVCAACYATAKL